MCTLFPGAGTVHRPKRLSPLQPPHTAVLIGLSCLLSSLSAIAQLATPPTQLQTYTTYAVSMKAYYNALWTADRAEFVDIQKGKNWNLVPSVGLVFGLPSVNLNTGQIANYKQRQGETRAKLKSLELRYTVLLNQALNELQIELAKAAVEARKLELLGAGLSTKRRIFTIAEEAYRKHETAPLEFYRERLSYENAEQDRELAENNYRLTILGIEKLAHYHTPHEVIYYTDVAEEDEGRGVGSGRSLDILPPTKP